MEQTLTILLAEDDPGHATLVRRNLSRSGVVNDVVWVENGKEALDYIRSEGSYAGREGRKPLVLLLDINMPVMDGLETLRQLKGDSRTQKIPVMMLTTTDDPREIERCYELGCSVYVTKPLEYKAFSEAIKQLSVFLKVIEVPLRSRADGEVLLRSGADGV